MARIHELWAVARALPESPIDAPDGRAKRLAIVRWRRTLSSASAESQSSAPCGCGRLELFHAAHSRLPRSPVRPAIRPAHLPASRRAALGMEPRGKLRPDRFRPSTALSSPTGAALQSCPSLSACRARSGSSGVRHSPQRRGRISRAPDHQLALSSFRSAYRTSRARPAGLRKLLSCAMGWCSPITAVPWAGLLCSQVWTLPY